MSDAERGTDADVFVDQLMASKKQDVAEGRLRLAVPPAEALDAVRASLAALGQLRNGDADVVGVVGTGFARMNPAVVTATLLSGDDRATVVEVRSAAGEGMVKQHGGRQAFDALVADLRRSHDVVVESSSVSLTSGDDEARGWLRRRLVRDGVGLALVLGGTVLHSFPTGMTDVARGVVTTGLMVAGVAVVLLGRRVRKGDAP